MNVIYADVLRVYGTKQSFLDGSTPLKSRQIGFTTDTNEIVARLNDQLIFLGAGVQGEQGEPGEQGPPGRDGAGVTILGSYTTEAELNTNHPTGNLGDAYLIDGDLFVWSDEAQIWVNVGHIQGPPGEQGEQGEQGPPGAPGRDGQDGQDGRDGIDGQDGLHGLNGLPGQQGPPGEDGRDGVDGQDGAPGLPGARGAQFWGTVNSATISDISSSTVQTNYPGVAIGDYFVNTRTTSASITILGTTAAIGAVVRIDSNTTGTLVGNIRGAQGETGAAGTPGATGAPGQDAASTFVSTLLWGSADWDALLANMPVGSILNAALQAHNTGWLTMPQGGALPLTSGIPMIFRIWRTGAGTSDFYAEAATIDFGRRYICVGSVYAKSNWVDVSSPLNVRLHNPNKGAVTSSNYWEKAELGVGGPHPGVGGVNVPVNQQYGLFLWSDQATSDVKYPIHNIQARNADQTPGELRINPYGGQIFIGNDTAYVRIFGGLIVDTIGANSVGSWTRHNLTRHSTFNSTTMPSWDVFILRNNALGISMLTGTIRAQNAVSAGTRLSSAISANFQFANHVFITAFDRDNNETIGFIISSAEHYIKPMNRGMIGGRYYVFSAIVAHIMT